MKKKRKKKKVKLSAEQKLEQKVFQQFELRNITKVLREYQENRI